MSKILDYLNEVDANAKLKALHEADPEGTMKSYGLTDAEIKALQLESEREEAHQENRRTEFKILSI